MLVDAGLSLMQEHAGAHAGWHPPLPTAFSCQVDQSPMMVYPQKRMSGKELEFTQKKGEAEEGRSCDQDAHSGNEKPALNIKIAKTQRRKAKILPVR